jgi:gamma-glutamyltranspeptidase/glutathione hydrolase
VSRIAIHVNPPADTALKPSRQGTVVSAHAGAAQCGARILAQGGSAVDAAITMATVLGVVDPANCGIGGYGGGMVIHQSGNRHTTQIDFNTMVPAGFSVEGLVAAPRSGAFVHGGPAVSFPAVVAGLSAAHADCGRLEFADLLRPAIELARDGFTVGEDLHNNLSWAAARHRGLSDEFRSIFFRGGVPLQRGEQLRQPALADSLEYVAQHGRAAFHSGPLAQAVCAVAAGAGGTMSIDDFAQEEIAAAPAETIEFGDASIHGTSAGRSGFGVLAVALERLRGRDLGLNRGQVYIDQIFSALSQAWAVRRTRAENLVGGARHTNHFCVADAQGTLVSLTFTHGPLWFGSGLVAPGTGIVLNAGANLFARCVADGSIFPMTNLTPVVLDCADGSRHAIGSPGGIRIPAIVLQMILDALVYGLPLHEAIAAPRVSVTAGGALEVEPQLLSALAADRDAQAINTRHYYGPAAALTVTSSGDAIAARDPRFSCAVAHAADYPTPPHLANQWKEEVQ